MDFEDLQKPKRVVDWDYLADIKQQPSCVSGKKAEPHHLITVGAGGSDYCAVPLTRPEHNEIHRDGLKEFEKNHKINLWFVAWRCLESWVQINRGKSSSDV